MRIKMYYDTDMDRQISTREVFRIYHRTPIYKNYSYRVLFGTESLTLLRGSIRSGLDLKINMMMQFREASEKFISG